MSAMPEAIMLHTNAVTSMICSAGGATVPEDTMPALYNAGHVSVDFYQTFTQSASSLILGRPDVIANTDKDEFDQLPWLSRTPGASSRHMIVSITLTASRVKGMEVGETVWLGLLHDDGGMLGIALFW